MLHVERHDPSTESTPPRRSKNSNVPPAPVESTNASFMMPRTESLVPPRGDRQPFQVIWLSICARISVHGNAAPERAVNTTSNPPRMSLTLKPPQLMQMLSDSVTHAPNTTLARAIQLLTDRHYS